MLEGGKGETVFEAREGVIRLVYVLDLTCTREGDDRRICGVDGLNTWMRGVDKDDFLAVDRKNLKLSRHQPRHFADRQAIKTPNKSHSSTITIEQKLTKSKHL